MTDEFSPTTHSASAAVAFNASNDASNDANNANERGNNDNNDGSADLSDSSDSESYEPVSASSVAKGKFLIPSAQGRDHDRSRCTHYVSLPNRPAVRLDTAVPSPASGTLPAAAPAALAAAEAALAVLPASAPPAAAAEAVAACLSFPAAEHMAREYPFDLDVFQKRSVAVLERGDHLMVAAHTSAGKTVVAEYAVALALARGQRVVYTSPIKALSNQKFGEMKERFPGIEVGLMTGDVTLAPDAPVVVMTTEILRNLLVRGAESIAFTSHVVFDEVHYMRDRERGVVWEETIILLPARVGLVFLSATVSNAEEFADWVCAVKRRPCHTVTTSYRPTPLAHFVLPPGGSSLYLLVDQKGRFHRRHLAAALDAAKAASGTGLAGLGGAAAAPVPVGGGVFAARQRAAARAASDVKRVVALARAHDWLPMIVFSFARRECEAHALACAGLQLNSAEEAEAVEATFEAAVARLEPGDRGLLQVRAMLPLLRAGVGVHHSGLLPVIKELVELLFQEGLIKVLFATETFAMGVNMPARTVVFAALRKFDGKTRRLLNAGEYTQMSGRAGRRNKDAVGVCVILMQEGDELEPEQAHDMILGPAEPLESRFRLSYAMILSLLARGDALLGTDAVIRSSLAQFRYRRAFEAQGAARGGDGGGDAGDGAGARAGGGAGLDWAVAEGGAAAAEEEALALALLQSEAASGGNKSGHGDDDEGWFDAVESNDDDDDEEEAHVMTKETDGPTDSGGAAAAESAPSARAHRRAYRRALAKARRVVALRALLRSHAPAAFAAAEATAPVSASATAPAPAPATVAAMNDSDNEENAVTAADAAVLASVTESALSDTVADAELTATASVFLSQLSAATAATTAIANTSPSTATGPSAAAAAAAALPLADLSVYAALLASALPAAAAVRAAAQRPSHVLRFLTPGRVVYVRDPAGAGAGGAAATLLARAAQQSATACAGPAAEMLLVAAEDAVTAAAPAAVVTNSILTASSSPAAAAAATEGSPLPSPTAVTAGSSSPPAAAEAAAPQSGGSLLSPSAGTAVSGAGGLISAPGPPSAPPRTVLSAAQRSRRARAEAAGWAGCDGWGLEPVLDSFGPPAPPRAFSVAAAVAAAAAAAAAVPAGASADAEAAAAAVADLASAASASIGLGLALG